MLTLAVAVLASNARAFAPASKPIGFACALKSNGALRAVPRLQRCQADEVGLHLRVGPVYACVQSDGSVRRVALLTRCRDTRPKRRALTLPPATRATFFCRGAGAQGALRFVSAARSCNRRERLVFVAPRTSASNDFYTVAEDTSLSVAAPGVLENDSSPSRRLTPRLVSAPQHAASFRLSPTGSFHYRPAPNYSGGDRFSYRVGNRREGMRTAVASILVSSVNDGPVNVVPGGQTTGEDTPLVLSSATHNAISTADVDAGAAGVQMTLVATRGTLTLDALSGLSFVGGDGTGDTSMTFRGTVAAVNAALDGLRYLPQANYAGVAALAVTTYDQGHSGGGSGHGDTSSVPIVITAIDDAPVNGLPAPQTADDNMGVVLSTAKGNALSISDVDADSSPVEVTLGVSHATLTLFQTTGLHFTTGDGTDDASMVFTGTLANVNVALDGLAYVPPALGYAGPDTLSVTTDDLGHTGAGGPRSDSDDLPITVQHFNRAPVNTVPAAVQSPPAVVFSAANMTEISVSDSDADSAPLKVALSVANGTLTLSQTTGLNFTVGDGSADAAMTFTGSQSAINAALNNMTYTPLPGSTADTLNMTTNDQGNTGIGGPRTDTDAVAITVLHVNAAPVNTAPASASTPGSTPKVFPAGGPDEISTADDDAGSAPIKVSLGVDHGTLTLSHLTGLSFTAGDGNTDSSMVFQGTLSNINAALNGLIYDPSDGYEGADTLSITTNDLGNTGAGGEKTDSDTVAITVLHVNVAPVNVVPGPQSTPTDTPLVFSSANANAISTSDADAGSNVVQMSLSVASGTLTLSQITGLSFTTGDGSADASMVFEGTLSDINAALSGMSYNAGAGYEGADTLNITTGDEGHTGVGGAKSDHDTVPITVLHVNQAPVNVVPGSQSTPAGTPLVFSSATGDAISTSDADAGSALVQISLSVVNGTLTLSTTNNLAFTIGDGTGDSSMVFEGTLTAVNTALNGLSYSATDGYEGADTLSITTSDEGHTGAGGAKTDHDSVAITVQHVNLAPANTVPAAQGVAVDATLVLSSANGNALSTSDADAGSAPVQITLSVDHGMLTLNGTTNLTFNGGANGSASMVFTGTLADVNAALDGLSYTPDGGYAGPDTLTISTADQGATGVGGPQSDTDALAISVS